MNATDHPGDRLSAYVDGELPAAERTVVDAHLRECFACSRLLDELVAVDSAALALTVQAPQGYFDAFPARVRGRLAARRTRRVPAWTWAAAAAVLLAVLTPLTLRDRRAPAPAAVPAAEQAPARRARAPEASSAAPTTTTPPAGIRSFGYVAGGPAPAPEVKERERRQEPETLDDRLRARDEAPAAGGGRGGELKGELKKEAATADKASADAPAARANVQGASADKQRPSDMDSRAEPDAAPLPAAPPPVTQPPVEQPSVAQAQVARPKAAEEGTLRAGKAAAAPARGAPAPTPTALDTAEGADARLDGTLAFADAFESLASRPLRTAAEARAAAREWSDFARRRPREKAADEARVRAIEALATAWRLERQPADRDQARRLAQAYLAGAGPQAARVRALLLQLDS